MTKFPSWVEALVASALFVAGAVIADVVGNDLRVKAASYLVIGSVIFLYEKVKGQRADRLAMAADDLFTVFCRDLFSEPPEEYERRGARLPFQAAVLTRGPLSRFSRWIARRDLRWFTLQQTLTYNIDRLDPDYGLILRKGQGIAWQSIAKGATTVYRKNAKGRSKRVGMTDRQIEQTSHVWDVLAIPLRRERSEHVVGVLCLVTTSNENSVRDGFTELEQALQRSRDQSQLRDFADRISNLI